MFKGLKQKKRNYQSTGESDDKVTLGMWRPALENNEIKCVCINLSSSVLLDKKEKIQKLKAYQDTLMDTLGEILENHAPLPQNEPVANRKKKVQWNVLCFMGNCAFVTPIECRLTLLILFQNIEVELNENMISLNEILEVSFLHHIITADVELSFFV